MLCIGWVCHQYGLCHPKIIKLFSSFPGNLLINGKQSKRTNRNYFRRNKRSHRNHQFLRNHRFPRLQELKESSVATTAKFCQQHPRIDINMTMTSCPSDYKRLNSGKFHFFILSLNCNFWEKITNILKVKTSIWTNSPNYSAVAFSPC